MELNNKPPKWNEQKQIYMLDFKGRVDKPSVKNFILTFKDQEEVSHLLISATDTTVWPSWLGRVPPRRNVSSESTPGIRNRHHFVRYKAGMLMILYSIVDQEKR